jgi:hypothetical protein
MTRKRKIKPEQGASLTGAIQVDIPTMVAPNLLRNGQPQSGTPLFAIAYKGLENQMANGLGNARAVVRNADF